MLLQQSRNVKILGFGSVIPYYQESNRILSQDIQVLQAYLILPVETELGLRLGCGLARTPHKTWRYTGKIHVKH